MPNNENNASKNGRVEVSYNAGRGSISLDQNPIRPTWAKGPGGSLDFTKAQLTFVLEPKHNNADFSVRFGNIALCDWQDEAKVSGDGHITVERKSDTEWTFTIPLHEGVGPDSAQFLVAYDIFCVYEVTQALKSFSQHTTLRQSADLDPTMLLPPGG